MLQRLLSLLHFVLCICSDSGDSLFITQKPVANAGRSGRQRSTPISPSFLEGSWSSNDPEADRGLGKKKNRHVLPKYNFPFLKRGKLKSRDHGLLAKQYNTGIHVISVNSWVSLFKTYVVPNCISFPFTVLCSGRIF